MVYALIGLVFRLDEERLSTAFALGYFAFQAGLETARAVGDLSEITPLEEFFDGGEVGFQEIASELEGVECLPRFSAGGEISLGADGRVR